MEPPSPLLQSFPIWETRNEKFGGIRYPFKSPQTLPPLPLKTFKQDSLNPSHFGCSFYSPFLSLHPNSVCKSDGGNCDEFDFYISMVIDGGNCDEFEFYISYKRIHILL